MVLFRRVVLRFKVFRALFRIERVFDFIVSGFLRFCLWVLYCFFFIKVEREV